MRIVGLEVSNVKAIRAVSISPKGDVVTITGPNGAGKSTILDAIYYCIGGKKALPSRPVRRGEESAEIALNLGEVIVTRKFVGEKTEVMVEAKSGARFPSPQRLLDDLYGELTFDPLKFALADAKAQLETLRGLVKLDVDVDALDGQNARDYEYRRDWNRKVASLKERVATLASGIHPAMDVTPIDVDALTATMAQASEHNAAIDREAVYRGATRVQIRDRRDRAAALRKKAEELLAEAAEIEETADRYQAELDAAAPLADPIDVTDLRNQISEAMKTNALRDLQRRQREAHATAARELAEAQATSDELTAAMDARTAQKADAIARAKMPIPGLGFGDGEVLYNGIPFEQASAAERIRVSFAIAIATNPKLRIALIRDGSLLDEDNLALIAQMAAENDFQVWLERVDKTGKVGVLITDGEVTAVDGVPVEGADRPITEAESATAGA